MAKHSALDIAKHIISKCTFDEMPISNLQLQKILYYIQRDFLKNSAALFNDKFEAWQFGPVVPSVYYQYCGFGALPIRMQYSITLDSLTPEELKSINDIIDKKRKKNPWELVEETHKPGGAWDRVYNSGLGNHQEISVDDIILYG
ncbi:MAG: SocA family protein [Candidatus Methanofastidiosa archaeon]|nr:SocA family protein [Candidatus Methanofastidiosa archaeon]